MASQVLHSEYQARLKSPYHGRTKSPRRVECPSQNANTQQHVPLPRPTALTSPSTKKPTAYVPTRSKRVYSDRFIPSRTGSLIEAGYCVSSETPAKKQAVSMESDINGLPDPNYKNRAAFSMLLQNEILGLQSPRSPGMGDEFHSNPWDSVAVNNSPTPNLLRFQAPREKIQSDFFSFSTRLGRMNQGSDNTMKERKIPKMPFKVLDAPALQDDFYLNLVDWSALNVLAVGLGSTVYLWSACTSKVTKLCDLGTGDSVTSVTWSVHGNQLSIGTHSGQVQIWDAVECKHIRTYEGHIERVGTLAWSSQLLASGSRDKSIYLRDVRCESNYTTKLVGHKQEICGLKWSNDDQQLASGGNDNKLMIWNCHSAHPVLRFSDHNAAVKAIAWSPHQSGVLASGGGTADRCIRFWNTLHGSRLQSIDTGSQVCNLMWSKNSNEVVSTHGYSLNQIIVWKYPTMNKVATLTGHTYRVLYLAMSPDGQTIVTGAGDETLRFWNAFPTNGYRKSAPFASSLHFPMGAGIR
ncbi:WD repeat-containing protein srw1 [Thraustotheca clavata]|uniref:WD repeat-containing protein srw1 n=1 Tax=Thraustotheca clavata TaxID=74557 RepID=A0A1W0ABI8_9STRA|nr:WD repeat-containing protein srw1 [Thraustotheca clavata]